MIAGSLAYKGLEQLDGRASPETDASTLGRMAVQRLTGVVPFAGTM
jgi:hypothetical protein